ncbi:hypothetical protein P261_00504 [Lachnospiraceae bacterium TWA4]|nr:hypothetical protein P261_00504 [Lachnospiraceae bacterium TWA4]
MCNKNLRKYFSTHNLRHWQVAEILGISEWKFSRMLRHELPEEKKQEIIRKIDEALNEA